ncbi:hypothetical protein QEZ54_20445 [Catellatospora sp. KI3]|uniref:hypothetical protein n=1 Tax=Catellatospora sp. KI3 TaxID=3041620 RepID=UPI0024823E1C|nr:hypothetical protein [Catellatospora sp. KI3]MDI1463356.1 hypothetical protein [Catellatospora sp. KI3]
MAKFSDVSITDLETAYTAWPGSSDEKAALWALILRVRIERAAAGLPRSVIAAPPEGSVVERRLYLSLGDPGLAHTEQTQRLRRVSAAVGVYSAICELLHGRNPDSQPPLQDIDAWTIAVNALETELGVDQPVATAGRGGADSVGVGGTST